MQQSQYGYVWQKGNRWFIRHGASVNCTAGFTSLSQWNDWIKNKDNVEWISGRSWKYYHDDIIYELVRR